jgi:Zn ribbon nucleic-acid-binding protein
MSDKLLPCPFCGSEDIMQHMNGEKILYICCDDCGCFIPRSSIEKWNTRADTKEENSDNTEQIKAKIAASLEKFLSCQDEFNYDQALSDFIEQIRQLSAEQDKTSDNTTQQVEIKPRCIHCGYVSKGCNLIKGSEECIEKYLTT